MTNNSERETRGETRTNGLLSANLQRILDERGWRQADLVEISGGLGLLNWDAITASRTLSGERTMTAEEAIVLTGLFAVPFTEWLAGDEHVELSGGYLVEAAHLRDIVETGGKVGGSSGDTPSPLDSAFFTSEFPPGSGPLDMRFGNELGVSMSEIAKAAKELWSAPAHEELERRVRESPDRRLQDSTSVPEPAVRRRRRALQGRYAAAMMNELKEHGVGQ